MKKIYNLLNKPSSSFAIFVFINLVFFIKYLERVTEYYLILSFILCSFYFIVWNLRTKINKCRIKSIHNWAFILTLTLVSIALFYKIDVSTLRVDRWSVITSFWDNYFNNDYVYYAISHMGSYPGPMPFYFILALPFYLIGELGFLTIIGIILFYNILKKEIKSESKLFIGLLIITSSVFIFWEIVCRSNLFFNGVLILYVVKRFLDTKTFNRKEILITSCLFGLTLSTRNVYAIPFIIAFCYSLRIKSISIKQIMSIGIISATIFVLTFLPFIWNHFDDFTQMNPFLIQSSFLMPFEFTIPFIIMAFLISFLCKTKNDVYYYSGITLFSTIVGYYLYYFSIVGFEKTFFGSKADISYFILSTPFLIYYFITEKLKKTNSSSLPKYASAEQ